MIDYSIITAIGNYRHLGCGRSSYQMYVA